MRWMTALPIREEENIYNDIVCLAELSANRSVVGNGVPYGRDFVSHDVSEDISSSMRFTTSIAGEALRVESVV